MCKFSVLPFAFKEQTIQLSIVIKATRNKEIKRSYKRDGIDVWNTTIIRENQGSMRSRDCHLLFILFPPRQKQKTKNNTLEELLHEMLLYIIL